MCLLGVIEPGVFKTGVHSVTWDVTLQAAQIFNQLFLLATITVDNEIQIGWGGDTWGENEWGELSGSQPTITGISASFSIGSVTQTADANVEVSGISLSTSIRIRNSRNIFFF